MGALQLAITSSKAVHHAVELHKEEEEKQGQSILDTNAGFYNRKILKVSQVIIILMIICPVQASSQPQSPDQQQSPIDLVCGEPDPSLGPISFLYTSVASPQV